MSEVPAPTTRARTGLYVKASPGLRLRDRKVTRLVRKMRAALPALQDCDMPACRAWAQFEYLAEQVYAILRTGAVVNAKGEGKRLLDDYRKLRQAQLLFARELGLTPAARRAIRMGKNDEPIDIAALMAAKDDPENQVEVRG